MYVLSRHFLSLFLIIIHQLNANNMYLKKNLHAIKNKTKKKVLNLYLKNISN